MVRYALHTTIALVLSMSATYAVEAAKSPWPEPNAADVETLTKELKNDLTAEFTEPSESLRRDHSAQLCRSLPAMIGERPCSPSE